MDNEQLRETLRGQQRAFRQLVSGSETLLQGRSFWTERALLIVVHWLYSGRLAHLSAVVPEMSPTESIPNPAVREAMVEAMVEAALGGHELGIWEPVEGGYQATCRGCGMTSWMGNTGLRYSLLEDVCEGAPQHG